MTTEYDVAIIGGGLAGLSLALHLRLEHPTMRALIVEKRSGPAPEAAFKVGESVVELASFYFGEVLGLKDHLTSAQLPKFGLRYFMTEGDNRDISRRCEFGPLRVHDGYESLPFHGLPLAAYNVDRGRLENFLQARCEASSVEFCGGTRVDDVRLGDDRHTLQLAGPGGNTTATARWLVDASGRAGVLKRMLGLARTTEHQVDAVWFRVDLPIDPEMWSEDARWRGRTRPGLRRLSTNHLMGRGYWVWLIPLASGGTSVGIVADASLHDVKRMNTLDLAIEWLHTHEPQCGATIDAARDAVQDFHVMRGGAYGCRRLFSPARWAITGEAGVYLDPLYSPGSDFIAVSNTLIVDLIARDLAGESITAAVHFGEALYQGMFQQYLLLYRGQYALMGNPRVMVAKIVWDTAIYFGYTLLLFHNRRLCDRRFFASAREQVKAVLRLQGTVQALCKRWAHADRATPSGPGDTETGTGTGTGHVVDQSTIEFLWELYTTSKRTHDDPALLDRLGKNVAILEAYAGELARQVSSARPAQRSAAVDLSADMRRLWPA